MNSTDNQLLEAALGYARIGWFVIPLHSVVGGKCTCAKGDRCPTPGKHPRTKHGVNDASADPGRIDAWWRRWPDANVGIATGAASGIVAVDVDPRHGGNDSWSKMIELHGKVSTVEAITGGDGRHHLFAHPGIRFRNRAAVRPGIDIRGDGGYVVAAPSIHVSGNRYRWVEGFGPDEAKLAPLPDWARVAPDSASTGSHPGQRRAPIEALASLTEASGSSSEREEARAWLVKRATRYVARSDGEMEGNRNNTALGIAGQLAAYQLEDGSGKLSEDEILQMMLDWAGRCTPPFDAEELRRTIYSALHNGTPRSPKIVKPRRRSRGKENTKRKKTTQTQALVDLVSQDQLFHSRDGEAYVRFRTGDPEHIETWPVKSKGFGQWLVAECHQRTQMVLGDSVVSAAVNTIAGLAIHRGPEYAVHLRVAGHGDSIWIDLGDSEWRVVGVSAVGWQVLPADQAPVRFVRKAGSRPLPVPVQGGSLDELRRFVNLPDEGDWTLYLGWLVSAFRPRGPYTILILNGEQGSAKSTLARLTRQLIDPCVAMVRQPSKDIRDIMISATNAWVVSFDNLSSLSTELSNGLCSLVTGGGYSTRALYTDDEEKHFEAARPVILNGIEDLGVRADLMDRAIVLSLPAIPDGSRRTEDELNHDFEQACPRILGALLDAVSVGLRRFHQVRPPQVFRMADVTRWVCAAEPGLGLAEGAFLKAYAANRAEVNLATIECSPIGPAILYLMKITSEYRGSAGELLKELNGAKSEFENLWRDNDWPRNPRVLSHQLRQLLPALRQQGVLVSFPRGSKKRLIVIRRQSKSPESSSVHDSCQRDSNMQDSLPTGSAQAGSQTEAAPSRLVPPASDLQRHAETGPHDADDANDDGNVLVPQSADRDFEADCEDIEPE